MSDFFLSAEEQAVLWARKAAGDERAIAELVEAYKPMAYAVAKRQVIPSHVDRSDIESEALLGLVQAVQRFNPEISDGNLGRHFSSFAKRRIAGAILDYIKSHAVSWVPRTVYAKVRERRRVEDDLIKELNRDPTEFEVAERMGVGVMDLPRASVVVPMAPAVSSDDYGSMDLIGDSSDVGMSAEMSSLVDSLSEAICRAPKEVREAIWALVSTTQGSAARRASKVSLADIEKALVKLRELLRDESIFG